MQRSIMKFSSKCKLIQTARLSWASLPNQASYQKLNGGISRHPAAAECRPRAPPSPVSSLERYRQKIDTWNVAHIFSRRPDHEQLKCATLKNVPSIEVSLQLTCYLLPTLPTMLKCGNIETFQLILHSLTCSLPTGHTQKKN